MAGRMGGENVNVQNQSFKVVAERTYLLLKDVFLDVTTLM
jgi:ribosomal protein L3